MTCHELRMTLCATRLVFICIYVYIYYIFLSPCILQFGNEIVCESNSLYNFS